MSKVQNNNKNLYDLPLVCFNEQAAVEFWEKHRWNKCPCCTHCDSENVYKMRDAMTGERNQRFLWRCRDCNRQFTVRIGVTLENSRIPLRHWCYVLWCAYTNKNGTTALEIQRHTRLSHKSNLFLIRRIKFALKLTGGSSCTANQYEGRHNQVITKDNHQHVGHHQKPGPKEERLKFNMDWEDAAKQIVKKNPHADERPGKTTNDDH